MTGLDFDLVAFCSRITHRDLLSRRVSKCLNATNRIEQVWISNQEIIVDIWQVPRNQWQSFSHDGDDSFKIIWRKFSEGDMRVLTKTRSKVFSRDTEIDLVQVSLLHTAWGLDWSVRPDGWVIVYLRKKIIHKKSRSLIENNRYSLESCLFRIRGP